MSHGATKQHPEHIIADASTQQFTQKFAPGTLQQAYNAQHEQYEQLAHPANPPVAPTTPCTHKP